MLVALLAWMLYRRLAHKHKSVAGKVVVITGGAMGLGKNLAARFTALGCAGPAFAVDAPAALLSRPSRLRSAKVVLWDIDEHRLRAVANELTNQRGGPVWNYVCDVTDRCGALLACSACADPLHACRAAKPSSAPRSASTRTLAAWTCSSTMP